MDDAPRLFLITPRIDDAAAFAPLLETACAAADVACVLIRVAAPDEHAVKAAARLLAPIAQARGAAALIEAPRLAARLDVDGVQVAGVGETLDEALAALQPKKIVGTGALESRDAAMAAGEAGVDYVMFGAPGDGETHEAILERVAWWARIFNVPCVGYARHPDLAGEIAAAGPEFVGLCEGLWDHPDGIAATLATVAGAMQALEPVR